MTTGDTHDDSEDDNMRIEQGPLGRTRIARSLMSGVIPVARVRVDLPWTIPAGAAYNIYVTNQAYDTKTITIRDVATGEPLVQVSHDGVVSVFDRTVRRELNPDV